MEIQRSAACILLVFLCAPWSKAQEAGSNQFPKIEIFGGYSSIETNDHTFRFSPGFNASNTE